MQEGRIEQDCEIKTEEWREDVEAGSISQHVGPLKTEERRFEMSDRTRLRSSKIGSERRMDG